MNYSLTIDNLHALYLTGDLTPKALVDQLRATIESDTHNAWIYSLSKEEHCKYLDRLEYKTPSDLPLYGIPFAIKDNIDLAGVPTTAACQEYSYVPSESAFIVDALIKAGAIPMGKTNMDQFATGLVGTRSPEPWGPCKNPFNQNYISGGSSSGSAVAAALGQVSFSLGTDTAGSGRVPAMLNNLIGLKPSRGLLSMSGVVPACRSLDCPSIFALTATDANQIFNVLAVYDEKDVYGRPNPFPNTPRFSGESLTPPRIAIPFKDNLEFFGDEKAEHEFSHAVALWQSLGAEIHRIDISPMLEAAKLLYEGAWVTERYVAIESFMQKNPEAIHPVVREIVSEGIDKNAVSFFKNEYAMQGFRVKADRLLQDVDFLLTPTAPRTYTIDQVLNDPKKLNSNMGYYTNFMNLLDLCGVAVPSGNLDEDQKFGTTLAAKKFSEQKLLAYAKQWQQGTEFGSRLGATQFSVSTNSGTNIEYSEFIDVAVCGAHLEGMPLNWQLSERGASLKSKTKSAPCYRLYALAGGPPHRPALVHDADQGAAIEVEVWSVPSSYFGSFVSGIPSPLGIGKVKLSDSRIVTGFICEHNGIANAKDITDFGGWRAFIDSQG